MIFLAEDGREMLSVAPLSDLHVRGWMFSYQGKKLKVWDPQSGSKYRDTGQC